MPTHTSLRKGFMILSMTLAINFIGFSQDSDAPVSHTYKFKVEEVSSAAEAISVFTELDQLEFITEIAFDDPSDNFYITTNAPVLLFYIKDPLSQAGFHCEAILETKEGGVDNESIGE